MISLSTLANDSRPRKACKRVGRGIGSGCGRTCGRGEKGSGSRAGYKRRLGYEGGQFRTFMKIPIRGFNATRFQRPLHEVNLYQIEDSFEDGDVVNLDTLAERGFVSGFTYGVKILGVGTITKKITIEVNEISAGARAKLDEAKISYTILDQ